MQVNVVSTRVMFECLPDRGRLFAPTCIANVPVRGLCLLAMVHGDLKLLDAHLVDGVRALARNGGFLAHGGETLLRDGANGGMYRVGQRGYGCG